MKTERSEATASVHPRGAPSWPQTTVEEVMRPLKSLHTVVPQTSITKALEVMGREDLNQLPVVHDGRLKGIISRSHILRLLQTRAELQT